MHPDWEKLEILVSQLESLLSPAGVEVKHSERFYYEDGEQKAQVDVTLRLNAGSSRLLIGIECRLRPSDGHQGSDWIRDVASKKVQIGANHMLAVSGTGFAESAIRAAKELGVELRTVEDWNFDVVKHWFRPISLLYTKRNWEFLTSPHIEFLTPIQTKLTSSTPLLKIDNEIISLNKLISKHIEENIEMNITPLSEDSDIEVIYKNFLELDAIIEGHPVIIKSIEARLKVRTTVVRPKLLLNLYRDPSTSRTLVFGRCNIEVNDENLNLLITGKTDNEEKLTGFRGQIYDIDGNPYSRGEMQLQIWGYKAMLSDN